MSAQLRKQLQNDTTTSQRLDAIKQLASRIQTVSNDLEHVKANLNHSSDVKRQDLEAILSHVEQLENEIGVIRKSIEDCATIQELIKVKEDIKEEMVFHLENLVIEKVSETPRAGFDGGADIIMKLNDLTHRIKELEETTSKDKKPKVYLTRQGIRETPQTEKPLINKINLSA